MVEFSHPKPGGKTKLGLGRHGRRRQFSHPKPGETGVSVQLAETGVSVQLAETGVSVQLADKRVRV